MMKSLDPVGYAESGRMLRVHVALLHAGAVWVRWTAYSVTAIACFLIPKPSWQDDVSITGTRCSLDGTPLRDTNLVLRDHVLYALELLAVYYSSKGQGH